MKPAEGEDRGGASAPGPGAGLALTGPGGLLKQLAKTVLETALGQEMTEHLGHEKNGPVTGETGTCATARGPRRC